MNLLDMAKTKKVEEKPKKQEKPKGAEKQKKVAESGTKTGDKYKYPFKIQAYTQDLDISGMFTDGVEYTGQEINQILLEHQYFAFAGEVNWSYRAAENVLLPAFTQHKKG